MPEENRDRQILSAEDAHLERNVELIADEFRRGFEVVDRIPKPAVAIFGSARLADTHPVYGAAREAGRRFAEAGWSVVTGGGPGVMEGANRGAREGGGLPWLQHRHCRTSNGSTPTSTSDDTSSTSTLGRRCW